MDAKKTMEWQRIMICICNALLASSSLEGIINLCRLSEKMVRAVGELEKFIIDDLLKNGQSQQNYVCNLLAKFKGFNVNGCFTLNHSMLTKMLAIFVTYLVILVKFRQSGV